MSDRVLIVEDEFGIGLDIQGALLDSGFEVLGPVMTEEDALTTVAQGGFDLAVLDANLNGRNAGSVASLLEDKRIPFVVVSGYSREYLPLAIANAPLIPKPFEPSRLVNVLRRLRPAVPGQARMNA